MRSEGSYGRSAPDALTGGTLRPRIGLRGTRQERRYPPRPERWYPGFSPSDDEMPTVSRTPRRSRPNGFTLIEMVGALLLALALGSLGFATATRPSPRSEAGSTVLRMRAMLSAALADADLEGGDVVVRAEAASGAAGGRFLALSGAPGVMPADDPAADWIELSGGVRWRMGTAAADPMGTPTDGRVPGTIRCTATACETGAADYVVYFVGHARSARVAWALVLTRDREVTLFHWNPARAVWEAGAR